MTFNKTILPNGLRVVTVPMADNPSITVLVMVEAGSKYETKDINGISHFLEHMLFKGTPKRPTSSDISRELDSIGANYNAFTSHEFTGYYAKADIRHFDKILDVVSDLYLHPILDENELKKEKGVIVEEIRMYNDIPQKKVGDVFMELLYGDQPAGWNIAGTEENVRSFTVEQLKTYRSAHYRSGATTLVIAGSFDEKKAIASVADIFKDIQKGETEPKLKVTEKQSAPQIKAEFKETDQTHLIIGVRTFPIGDPRIPAMNVLSTILGKGMSSRLFVKMREELGICYYVRTEHDPFTDHGMLTISAGVDNSRVTEGVKGILGECRRLKDELVSPAELQKAKDYTSGTTMLDLETSDARAEFFGFQELLKRKIESPEELLAKVNAVTAEDVQKLAKEVFVNEGLNMAIVGRFKDGNEFEGVLKF